MTTKGKVTFTTLAFVLAFAIGMYAPLWDAMPWNH